MSERGFITSAHAVSEEGIRVDLRVGRHQLVSDEPPPEGTGEGPTPYGLLAAALIACTSITARMYADRKGWSLGEIKVDVRMIEDGDGPPVLRRQVRFSGDLDDDQRGRLAEIIEKTPVTRAVRHGLPLETTYPGT